MSERKPDGVESVPLVAVVVPGTGTVHTYELTNYEMIEMIAMVNTFAHDENGEPVMMRTFTQILLSELGDVKDLDNLSVTITVGRRRAGS